MFHRIETKQVKIGSLTIGGKNEVIIQSMTNYKTSMINKVVQQILELEKAGCQMVRVAILDEEDALSLGKIKQLIHIPLVADIHFDSHLAILAIENGADKIRINPGNIGSKQGVYEIVALCKKKNIPIRIGVNGGSLEKDLEDQYGSQSAKALFESAKRNITLLESLEFTNIVLSLKSSNLLTTIEAYKMIAEMYPYPLHIGVTEAGDLLDGAIKSSSGLGVLLYLGLGDTIRVSLSDNPVQEIKVAKKLLHGFGLYSQTYELIACPTCGRLQYDMHPIVKEISTFLNEIQIKVSVAIMGCSVNGPSEAKSADIGIAGGKDCAVLFKKGKVIGKIDQKEIINRLKEEILALKLE